jgi:hypothetical protein
MQSDVIEKPSSSTAVRDGKTGIVQVMSLFLCSFSQVALDTGICQYSLNRADWLHHPQARSGRFLTVYPPIVKIEMRVSTCT